jgi:hypothetical protein
LLHEVDAQHHLEWLGRAATFGTNLRIVRLDQSAQPSPRHYAIHLGKKDLASRRFRLLHEARFGKALLFHHLFPSCRGIPLITHQHLITSTGFSENP